MDTLLVSLREDGHDVCVVQRRRRTRLGSKPFDPLRVEPLAGRQQFQGDPAGDGALMGLVDNSHAASADFPDNLEVSQWTGRRHKPFGCIRGQLGPERGEAVALGVDSRLPPQGTGAAPIREQFTPCCEVDARVVWCRVGHCVSCCSNRASMALRARW